MKFPHYRNELLMLKLIHCRIFAMNILRTTRKFYFYDYKPIYGIVRIYI